MFSGTGRGPRVIAVYDALKFIGEQFCLAATVQNDRTTGVYSHHVCLACRHVLSVGGRIVLVTTHLAHFYGTGSFAAGIPRRHAKLHPVSKTRIPAELVTCERICGSM